MTPGDSDSDSSSSRIARLYDSGQLWESELESPDSQQWPKYESESKSTSCQCYHDSDSDFDSRLLFRPLLVIRATPTLTHEVLSFYHDTGRLRLLFFLLARLHGYSGHKRSEAGFRSRSRSRSRSHSWRRARTNSRNRRARSYGNELKEYESGSESESSVASGRK